MVFGDFLKVISFYNLFIYIINIAAFFLDFKLINAVKYFLGDFLKVINFYNLLIYIIDHLRLISGEILIFIIENEYKNNPHFPLYTNI